MGVAGRLDDSSSLFLHAARNEWDHRKPSRRVPSKVTGRVPPPVVQPLHLFWTHPSAVVAGCSSYSFDGTGYSRDRIPGLMDGLNRVRDPFQSLRARVCRSAFTPNIINDIGRFRDTQSSVAPAIVS